MQTHMTPRIGRDGPSVTPANGNGNAISIPASVKNAQLRAWVQAMAQAWGDGTASSSDGLRIRLGVKAANAQRNREHFDDMRGLTLYLHLGDVGAPLRQQIINTNASEAWYVIDGLCNHETEFNLQEHSTDTGGSSEHVFGMCHFLGFRFAPRLATPLDRQLWTIGRPAEYGPLNTLLKGRVSTRLIGDHWEDMQGVFAYPPKKVQ